MTGRGRATARPGQPGRRAQALCGAVVVALALGAGVLWQASTSAPGSAAAGVAVAVTAHPAPWSGELPPPPARYPGAATGCTLPDPTGTGGCVTGAAAHLVDQVGSAVGNMPMTCWSEHAWNPASDHRRGRGCDIFVGGAGQFPAGADLADGWRLAEWVRAHAEPLKVTYVIWQGRIWVADRAAVGWAPYDGGGVYDATDATGGHFDHLHVSVRD
ncbi:hypothetical protein [Georgenia yuyongxinii]|uniref:ARB-07466-like C-terminal domain-containing protein n=1 Tax=Georgenia yuyongxinii TaxID=2589797 RepID=A0A552WK43_9MICO|nr:hypothetical protein [Georgenia yuyongxinii]TRW43128.1 hypothetical protein FJ693_18900 [Georgenia yuyongxinii]